MGLRVGVFAGSPDGKGGGAWTFTATLVEAVKAAQTPHEFVMLDDLLAQSLQVKLQEPPADNPIPPPEQRWLLKKTADLSINLAGKLVGRHRRRAVDPPPQKEIPVSPDPQSEPCSLLETLARDANIDIVWFLTPMNEPLHLPYIATVWDLEHRKQPYFPEVSTTGWTWDARESAFSALLPRASMIITGTYAGKEEVAHYYRVNPENVAVIPLPVPAAALMRPSCGPAEIKAKYRIDCEFLFYPAQFWPHKNHINLLRALRVLTDQNHLDIKLVLTGSDKGNLSHVLNEIANLSLSDRVLTLGFIPREDLNALFRASTALVFPSYFGPDNLPPLEAFALGVPIAASNIAGAEEQLGEAALLFNPSDPLDLVAKIASLCRDSGLRAELVAKGAGIAKVRTPGAYIAKVCSHLDRFENTRRCWDSSYRHA